MKKRIAVLLSLVLCCLLLPAVAENASLAGVWYVSHGLNQGNEVSVTDTEAIVLTINEDGSFSITENGLPASGTWAADDTTLTLTAEGTDIVFMIEGDELAFEQEGTVLYLSRTPAEAIVLPAAVPAESAEAFDGTWVVYAQTTSGLYALMDEASVTATGKLVIESGKVTIFQPGEDGELREVTATEFSFSDDTLWADEEANSMTYKNRLTLREDGSMFYALTVCVGETPMMEVTYIYVRDAAAEEPAA